VKAVKGLRIRDSEYLIDQFIEVERPPEVRGITAAPVVQEYESIVIRHGGRREDPVTSTPGRTVQEENGIAFSLHFVGDFGFPNRDATHSPTSVFLEVSFESRNSAAQPASKIGRQAEDRGPCISWRAP